MLKVGDMVKTILTDDDVDANFNNWSGPISVPVCPLGIVIKLLGTPDNDPIVTVRLVPHGYTNNYFQSDLEVVSNV